MSDHENQRQPNSKFVNSCVYGAIVAVAVANLILLAAQPLSKVSPALLPAAHTWEWWRTREYLAEKRAPDVVFLGSSLLMIPLSLCDCDYLNEEVDVALHSHCQYLEQLVQKRGRENLSCFNFALPGGIVSDDYMIVRALMQGEKSPKVLVIGMTVRDFIDHHVDCSAASPVFRYLQRFTSVDDLVAIAMPEPWQRLDYFLGKAFYLEGKRLDIQVLSEASLKELVSHSVPKNTPVIDLHAYDPKSNKVVEKLSKAEADAFVLEPHAPWVYEDNSNEYRKRFGNGNDPLFKCQKQFLDKLLQLAQEKQIRVIIVNMPLTQRNMELTPKGYYSRYMDSVQQACAQYGAEFHDFNDGKSGFTIADFKDTAHMNAAGGKQLLDKLAVVLEPAHRQVASQRPPAAPNAL